MRRIAHLVLLTTLGVGSGAHAQVSAPPRGSRPAQAPARPATGAAAAPAQAKPAAAPRPTAPRPLDPEAQKKIDAILARWERASADTETLYAEFEQIEKLKLFNEEKHYKGKAYLLRPNLALLNLEKQSADGKTYAFDRRIVSTGAEILEYNPSVKQITVYPLPEDAQQRALEEGPLPFLFNMKLETFKKRYHAYLQMETEKSYRIVIVPLQAIDRDAFQTAVLDLNKQTLLPDAIYTKAANDKEEIHYLIKQISKNGKFDQNLFTWTSEKSREMTTKGWRILKNPPMGESEIELVPANSGAAPAVGRGPAAAPARPR